MPCATWQFELRVFSLSHVFPFILQTHVRMRKRPHLGVGVAALALVRYLWCGNHWLWMTIGITARCKEGAQVPRPRRRSKKKCRKVGTRNLPQPPTTQGDTLDLPWATKSPWCWALSGGMKGKEKLWISWLKTRIWCADVRLVGPHAAFTDLPALASYSKWLSWSGVVLVDACLY